MHTPKDKEIVFTLYSHPVKCLDMRWKARLAFGANSSDNSKAILTIVDGNNAPIKLGIFEFAGSMIKVKDGQGSLKCGDFIKGVHEKAIWLHRKGMVPIPGALTFE